MSSVRYKCRKCGGIHERRVSHFTDIRRGDVFRVDKSYQDEWFFRGDWMRTSDGRLCVCLTQGCNNQGSLKRWRDDIPVELVKPRCSP